MMFVRDFEETREISTSLELESFLVKRFDLLGAKVNSFWLCYEAPVPAMSILVRDNWASVDYMADTEGTAFVSVGTIPSLQKGESTLFYFDEQEQPVLNDQIVSFNEALQAAREFLSSKERPLSIKWFTL